MSRAASTGCFGGKSATIFSARWLGVGEDWRWLSVMALCAVAELLWWTFSWSSGVAPLPFVPVYLAAAVAALLLVLGAKRLSGRAHASWPAMAAGTLLIGAGASLFLPLKVAIPHQIPFWMDNALATSERALFGADPWLIAQRLFGFAIRPIDLIYGLWLPVQLIAVFSVATQPASTAKSRAMIAYALAWFALGVIAAALFSSAGPIFYDRLLGGDRFQALTQMLRSEGARVVLAESDAMWAGSQNAGRSLIAGISAFPSLHVAISLWIWLAARAQAARFAAAALGYFLFVWIASILLGWHYFSDGLAGAAGMMLVWWLAGGIERMLIQVDAKDRHTSA